MSENNRAEASDSTTQQSTSATKTSNKKTKQAKTTTEHKQLDLIKSSKWTKTHHESDTRVTDDDIVFKRIDNTGRLPRLHTEWEPNTGIWEWTYQWEESPSEGDPAFRVIRDIEADMDLRIPIRANPDEDNIQLRKITDGGFEIIASSDPKEALDTKEHTLAFKRKPNGEMSIYFDGKEQFTAKDEFIPPAPDVLELSAWDIDAKYTIKNIAYRPINQSL
jgi:hypothetical protein